MNLIERVIVYNYKVPYLVREILFHFKLFFHNKINYLWVNKANLKNNSKLSKSLKKEGIVFLGDSTKPNPSELQGMLSHLDLIDNKYAHNKDDYKISYETNDLAQNNYFINLALNDEVISLAGSYFNAIPKIAFLKAWKVNSGAGDLAEMSFHMDHHGHRFLKAFWYLNDVEEGSGHHEFIKKTHMQPAFDKFLKTASRDIKLEISNKRNKKGKFLMDNKLVLDTFKEDVLKISGVAGSAFIEDTRGLHRGTEMPLGKNRIIYQVLYVPYVSYKDKGAHMKISDTSKIEEICNSNPSKSLLYKSIFSDLI